MWRSVGAVVIFTMWALPLYSGDPNPRTRANHQPLDLQQLTQLAGVIFLGRVEKIEVLEVNGKQAEGTVRITFKVLDGIRGPRTGESYTVQEWRGLWVPGSERYRRGETLLMFFHPPGRLGLTSPVGGESGRLEVTPTRRVVLSPQRTQTLLPRSLRLLKQQGALETMRTANSAEYQSFAQVVRELADHPAQ